MQEIGYQIRELETKVKLKINEVEELNDEVLVNEIIEGFSAIADGFVAEMGEKHGMAFTTEETDEKGEQIVKSLPHLLQG